MTQSIPPPGVKKPEDVFYWAKDRLEHNKSLLEDMKKIATESGLHELVSPYSGERVILPSFIEKVSRSIEYSERVNDVSSGAG